MSLSSNIQFKYLLAASAFVLVAVVAFVVAINTQDPPLRSEAKAFLAQPVAPTTRQMEAMYFLLGLYQRVEISAAESEGRRVYETWLVRNQANNQVMQIPKNPDAWTTNFPGCFKKQEPVCTTQYLREYPEVREALQKDQGVIDAYLRLMDYGVGLSPLYLIGALEFSGFLASPHKHREFIAFMATQLLEGKVAEVFRHIKNSNDYMSSLLGRSSLLEQLIALNAIRANAQFLDLEKKANSRLRIPKFVLDSFPIHSESFTREMIEAEISIGARVLAPNPTASARSIRLDLISASYLAKLPLGWLYRPKETLNQYFEGMTEPLRSECKPKSEEEIWNCYRSRRWQKPKWPWQYLINPIGRQLVYMFTFGMRSRIERLNQLTGEIEEIRQRLK